MRIKGAAVGGSARVYALTGPDMDARNSEEEPEKVAVRDWKVVAAGPVFHYAFPAHSVTVLEMETGNG